MADEKIKIGPTFIHGIGSSQAIDTAGEIVDLAGIDCSSLLQGSFNWEHNSSVPASLVGKILEYKKIFSEKDCENEYHQHFWDKCKTPFLYVMGRLLDDKKDSSKEVAALFMDDAEHPEEPPMVGLSIEGSKVDKKGIVVTKSIARKVTITNAPANKQCIAELIPAQPQKADPDSIFKTETSFCIELFKSESMEKASPSWSAGKKVDNAIHFSHPEHGTISIHKQPNGDFHVKHNGTIAHAGSGISKKPGVFRTPNEAGKHAKQYMKAIDQKKTLGPQMHDRSSPQMVNKSEEQKYHIHMKGQRITTQPISIKEMKEQHGKTPQDMERNPDIKVIPHHPGASNKPMAKGMIGGIGMGGGLPPESTDKKNKRGLFNPDVDKITGRTGIVGGVGFGVGKSESKSNLKKAMTAGSGMAAPGSLVGGAALGKESLDKKMKKAITGHETGVNLPISQSKTSGKNTRPWNKISQGQSLGGASIKASGKTAGAKMSSEHNLKELKNIKPKLDKSEDLLRAEQEYASWNKREEFEAFMAKTMPHMAKGEIVAIGQVLCLSKSMKYEQKLKKMMAGSPLNSYVEKKEKK